MTENVPLHAGRVIMSSHGMHEMADGVVALLKSRGLTMIQQKVECQVFANGELKPTIPDTVRGEHVFLLDSLQLPDPNVALMRVLLTCDALKRASVNGITLVLPFMPYLRQDRKDCPRVPISGKLIANLLQINGQVERIITFDMHVPQIQGFFEIPVDDLMGLTVLVDHCRSVTKTVTDVTVVAADMGGTKRAHKFAQKLGNGVPVAIIDKRRDDDGNANVFNLVGSVVKRDCIICDDMVDGGSTALTAMEALKNAGARSVQLYVTHAIFSAGAETRFAKYSARVVATNTIPRQADFVERHRSWLTYVPVDQLLSRAIYEASTVGGSISKLSS